MPPKKTTVNWTYNGKEIKSLTDMPTGVIGFIYRIQNITTGKYYIGRRTIAGIKKKRLTLKEKLLPENNRKTFKYEYCESSGWKSYCGSNVLLKDEINNKLHEYRKEILYYCFSKSEITYLESREILCSGSLLDPLSYNDWIKCLVYKKNIIK